MKVLVLGGSGMFGSGLVEHLSPHFDLAYTVRGGSASVLEKVTYFPYTDAYDLSSIMRSISEFKPEVVINAIGVVKQKKEILPSTSIYLNAEFPYHLAQICELSNSKLILLSTDCVFIGSKGNYSENDVPDASDVYGRSKILGEICDRKHVLTIRSSTIGFEINGQKGLLEWFLSQSGIISGYKHAIYTGFPMYEFANVLVKIINHFPMLSGLYHISSDPISKFELLNKLKEKLNYSNIDLMENIEFKCDRSLNSEKFRKLSGYFPPTWDEMLDKLTKQIIDKKGKKIG